MPVYSHSCKGPFLPGTHPVFHWIFMLLLIISADPSFGRIIRVSQSGDNTDGNSWATAYHSISTAVSQSSDGDSIWVAGGTYSGGIFVEVNVNLLGGFLGVENENEEGLRDPYANPTIIDGGALANGILGVVSGSYIDGFRMRNAASAGLLIYNGASPSISRCIIECNFPTQGNTPGGGVVINSSSPILNNCVISNNIRNKGGAGINISEDSSVYMKYCTIDHNTSYSSGGGGITCSHSSIIMENCIVTNNSAVLRTGDEPISTGGGIIVGSNNNTAILKNCLIADNHATEWKQLVIGESQEPYVCLENCTIKGESTADVHWGNTPPIMTNCILWGANGMLAGEQGEADISYSCIQGGYSGEGNISDDPLFRDPNNGNYRLLPESPCIDTGDMSGPSDDLRGCHRPVDIAGIGREATDAYDMGAYEFQEWELPIQSSVKFWNLYEARD